MCTILSNTSFGIFWQIFWNDNTQYGFLCAANTNRISLINMTIICLHKRHDAFTETDMFSILVVLSCIINTIVSKCIKYYPMNAFKVSYSI